MKMLGQITTGLLAQYWRDEKDRRGFHTSPAKLHKETRCGDSRVNLMRSGATYIRNLEFDGPVTAPGYLGPAEQARRCPLVIAEGSGAAFSRRVIAHASVEMIAPDQRRGGSADLGLAQLGGEAEGAISAGPDDSDARATYAVVVQTTNIGGFSNGR